MIYRDCIDDPVLIANTFTQAKSLLHSLEQAAVDIGMHANENKTDFTCFIKEGAISILSSKLLKSVD